MPQLLAQQLIAENKRTKAKSLDLGKCGLTDLEKQVPELFDCVWLEELLLCNRHVDTQRQKWIKSLNKGIPNELAIIPDALSKLQNLQTLYIGGDYNKKREIKEIGSLATLFQLKKLYLSYTQISDADLL